MNDTLMKKILSDIRIELLDEFQQNFRRKAFFTEKWPDRRFPGNGSLMWVTGNLSKSLHARINGNDTVIFSSDAKYASLHNNGGKLKVTADMKKYFWAMYYKTKAPHWKGMALKKEGSTITIPKRQFVGWHPTLQKNIDAIVQYRVNQYVEQLAKKMKK